MNKKVLIVDDSNIMRDLLKKALIRIGCTVCGDARNGREGIEMFKTLQPDIVFMDISMPVMDGVEAIKGLKELEPDAVIIVLSAVGDEQTVESIKELGVLAFLKKPFNDKSILDAISSV